MKIALWIIVAILVMLLGGLGWYTFTMMQENEEHLATINTLNEAAEQKPECASLDMMGTADIMTGSSEASEDMYCVTGADLSAAYMKEMEALNQSAKLSAELSTMNMAVKECIVADQFINESAVDTNVCDGVDEVKKWTDVTRYGAQWGGCEFMIDKEKQTFSYCAQAQAGAVITCTQDGCSESSMMKKHEEESEMMKEEMMEEGAMMEETMKEETMMEDETAGTVEGDMAPPLL